MNYEMDDLLDMVDEWKFALHDKLKNLNEEERAAFWKKGLDKVRAMGLPIFGEDQPPKRPAKRKPTKQPAKRKPIAKTRKK